MKRFLFVSLMFIILTVLGIAQKSIKVNSPNGGEQWVRGNIKQITWNSTNLENDVKITLWKNGVFKGLIKKNQPKNGAIDWNVGQYEGGIAEYGSDYKVKIREQGGDAFTTEDSSDGNFRIKSKYTIATENIPVFKKKPVFKPKPGMFKPKITAALDVPLGALKPGTRLFLKGKLFGKLKGKILIYGNFPVNPVELVNVQWVSDTKINGYVPQSMNGYKNQKVGVVVQTSYNAKSDKWNMGFEGREEKWVHPNDVVVIKCGDDANTNHCNQNVTVNANHQDAIVGYHKNDIATIGDDKGDDIYHIELKNGWKFSRLDITSWQKSSSDEMLSGPNPAFPVGKTTWTPVFSWLVSPHDHITYRLKIYVEGPIGTSYK